MLINNFVTIQEVRNILGEKAAGMSDDQITDFLTKMNFMVNGYLDIFERKIFSGKTLKEMGC